ncbi:MAG TPA: GAF domain-containing protein [Bryobacteraceae bacterium]|nr:GAF domain-containing protein [Bryobacteraceae bacterium]
MAAGTTRFALVTLLAAAAFPQDAREPASSSSPQPVSIASIHRRHGPSYLAGHLGEQVVVKGVVTTASINFGEYAHLPIQDDRGSGLLLERERGALSEFAPGDQVEATGTVAQRSGLPVLTVRNIVRTGGTRPPDPTPMTVQDLTRFENVGRHVTLDAPILAVGQNSGGDVVVLAGGSNSPVTLFYPRFARWEGEGLRRFNEGDKVRITGISAQYCPVAPYNRGFQILVDDPGQVTVLQHGWVIPPGTVLYLVITLLISTAIWWTRERRMAAQRRAIHNMMSLSEKVLSSNSIGEISRKVQAALPPILNASDVDLFLLNKTGNTLDRIPNDIAPELSISLEQPKGSYASAISLCFRNRTLLNVPDFSKSPLAEAAPEPDLPAASVFVPMFAQGEILGVIAVNFQVRPQPNRSQQTALQHVANQVAASLKLQEQQSIREQLLRTEKMAAAGQLISGVAHDLRAPLTAIRDATAELRSKRGEPSDFLIAAEADRGLQIVNHLLSFARMERSEARPVNLHELVSTVMEARESEWRRKGIGLENALPVSPVEVFADESELEQVVLSLLIHVEHAVENHPGKSVRLSSRVLGTRIQVSIDFAGPATLEDLQEEPTAAGSFGLRVCQAIVQSHGGDIRLFQTQHNTFRYEFELPVHHAPAPPELAQEPTSRPSRVLTMILIDQDVMIQRKLLAMMAVRGHRAIPVDQPEEAADMAQRMSFDVIFCTNRLPGLSWHEFFRRVRRRVGAFVLVTDDYDRDSTVALRDDVGFVMRKPVDEEELEHVLSEVESRTGVNKQ